jgi:hypothetical protein
MMKRLLHRRRRGVDRHLPSQLNFDACLRKLRRFGNGEPDPSLYGQWRWAVCTLGAECAGWALTLRHARSWFEGARLLPSR